ncbi:MAG TPA: phytoene desaturase family protein [Chloroflexota bacterium]|nr:phytoene desaturase family protein [Chloroflexota bacterium]
MPPETIVIGGGLGGLAASIRLRLAGRRVRLLEKNGRLGGRCNRLELDGFTFDTGPTLLLMRDVLDDLFACAGRRLEDYLDLVRLDPNYVIHFGDGSTLEISGDLDATAKQMDALETGAGERFRHYLADAGRNYRISRERFVERNFCHWHEFFTPVNLRYLLATHALRSLARHVGRFFEDERLRLALSFQTMYLGLSPDDAPSIYSLLPYTEIAEGIWYPRGGMYRIVTALARLAGELGVEIETGAEVREVSRVERRVTDVRTADRSYPADLVVCNADLPWASRALFDIPRRRRLNPGSSAFLLYLGLDRRYPCLRHHNVYLSPDPAANFDAIFHRHSVPRDPSFYVCAPTGTDPSTAPPGGEALYVLVPVPATSPAIDWSSDASPLREHVLDRLERDLPGLCSHIVCERAYTPTDFEHDYHISRGSAFGLSHALHQVGYFRPSNRALGYDNLYFVGASTVPGGGIPMVIIGSRLVAERIAEERR